MKATLTKEAIRIAYAAGQKSTRPVLQCVSIGNSEIVAADGFMLARRSIQTEPTNGEAILVNAKGLLEACRILKTDEVIIESGEDNKTATIKRATEPESGLVISITTTLIEGKFPAYTQIVSKTERKAYVALKASLLAKLLKAVGLESESFIKIKVREPNDPVEIHGDDTDAYLMPARLPEDQGG